MRPVTYAVIGVSILAAFMVTVLIAQQSQPAQEQKTIPTVGQPKFELGKYGQTQTLDDAEKMLEYKIKLPTYLPANNSLRMIKVNQESRWSFVIYSPVDVSDATNEKELIENSGFIIINAPISDAIDTNLEVQKLVDVGGKEISMQSVRGVGLTDIPLMPRYSEIHWWDGDLHRIVGGNFEFTELAKIIESI